MKVKSYYMKMYIVGDWGPEHNMICSVHKTYKGALKAWNKRRLELLGEAKASLKRNDDMKEMFYEIVRNLSCKDPKKIDNYAQETPYIKEYSVEE